MINWKTGYKIIMTFEDRIRESYPDFSKSFARLADYILESYIEVAFMTATELGHAIDVDATTVVRFSQRLGYTGYPEFQRDIRNRVKSHLVIQNSRAQKNTTAEVVKTALQELRTIIGQAYLMLDVDTIDRMVDKIGSSHKVVILYESLAEPTTYTLASLLEQGGFYVSTVQSNLADLARTVQVVNANDLLLSIEIVGDSPFTTPALLIAQSRGVSTAAIVGSPAIETARTLELVLSPQAQPTVELRMMLVNALVYAVCQALRWCFPERFAGKDQGIEELTSLIQEPVLR
jgi:DNA-binding MurR/RpiR family transcriptional regulator